MRPELEVSVLHDRNPLYVRLSDGGVRNGYTVKLLNKLYTPRAFRISVEGLPGAKVDMIGYEGVVAVPPDNIQSVQIYVTLDKPAVTALPESATPFHFVVTDIGGGAAAEQAATFQGPPR
jgi:polyferredoxin